MADYSDLKRFADASLTQQGRQLLEENRLTVSSARHEADGFLRLLGKSRDVFNFVDHPVLLLGPEGKIRDFRCDCSEGRQGIFCVHCAALALKAAEDRPQRMAHAEADGDPALKRADHGKGEICQYSFSFYNSTEDLYPNGEPPVLSLESFIAVLGNNRIALEYYAFASEFGGICYGMAAANSLFNWPRDGILPGNFRPGAVKPYDLPLDSCHAQWRMGLHEYLDELFITQMHPLIETRTREPSESLDSFIRELCGRINGYREGKNPLCIVGVSRQRGAGESFQYEGHELLPFRVDEEPGKSLRIAVYDCNHEGEEQYIEMDLDSAGKIVNWRYDMGSYGIWSHDGKGYQYDLDYVEHDQFHRFFVDRPVPIPGELGLFLTKNKLVLRNAANEDVLHINEEEGYRALSDRVKIRIPKALKGARPVMYAPAGSYTVDVRETEMTESAVTFATGKRSVEIRTDADTYSFEVDDEKETCAAVIPQVESTYYITIKSTDPQDQKEVRLEGVTGYEPLRFGQIRHTLYVEGISEKTQQDLYVDGREASLDLLTLGFPQEEKQEQKDRELLFNTAAEDHPQDEK